MQSKKDGKKGAVENMGGGKPCELDRKMGLNLEHVACQNGRPRVFVKRHGNHPA